jgi:hypothetical protein
MPCYVTKGAWYKRDAWIEIFKSTPKWVGERLVSIVRRLKPAVIHGKPLRGFEYKFSALKKNNPFFAVYSIIAKHRLPYVDSFLTNIPLNNY